MKSSGHMGLYALLRHSSSNELQMARQMIYLEDATTLHVDKRTSETGRTMVEVLKAANELLPFFMLDEMSPNVGEDAGGLNMAAFQRNVFRACGLVVIVMGTDSKISKLVSQTSGSYNKEHKWMSIVPKFHPYQIVFDNQQDQKVWKAIVARFSVVGYIAMNSRGRFAIHFVDEVVKVVKDLRDAKLVKLWDLLDEVFDRVSKDTQRREGFMKTRDGDYAQLMAIPFTNAKREEEPPLKKNTRGDREHATTFCEFDG